MIFMVLVMVLCNNCGIVDGTFDGARDGGFDFATIGAIGAIGY